MFLFFSRGICQKILVKLSNKKYWGWNNYLPLFLPFSPASLSFLLFKLDVSLIDSLSCLTALDTTSNSMLNGSGWSGHSCLVLEFRVEVFSHSLLSMIELWVFHIWPLLYGGSFLIFLVCWMFFLWNDVAFCHILSLHQFRWSCSSPFRSVDVVCSIGCFSCVESSSRSWNTFCLVRVRHPFNMLLIQCASFLFFLRTFTLMLIRDVILSFSCHVLF